MGQSRPVPEVSVVYLTHRRNPRFEWFVEAFARQVGDDDVEVLFVDGLHSPDRSAALDELVRGRFAWRHLPAKPNPWNGPQRLTRDEYFAPASARNTGLVCVRSPYLVFCDDCAVPMPGWWDEARAAARHGYVVAGAYEKHEEMVVEDGLLVGGRPASEGRDVRDWRWKQGDAEALVQVGGADLYGCSFGAPRELLLAVNGSDELCDPIGWSDCQLGLRLQRQGATIFYSRRMLTVESIDQYKEEPVLLKLNRSLEPEAYMQRLRDFGLEERSGDRDWSNLSMLYDLSYAAGTWSLGNAYDLGALREADLPATVAGFEERYWFDGVPLAEL
jgi:hypothetical protein